MKKNLFVFAAMLILALSSICFADSSWKLAGSWNYTLNIPSATVNGYPASLTEYGTITMHMKETDGVEYFSTFDQSWKGTLIVDGQKTDYNGSVANKPLGPVAYTPGSSYVTGNTQVIDGITVTAKYTLHQTEQNKIVGTAHLEYGAETANGSITATKQSPDGGGSGGGCNTGFAIAALLLFIPLAFSGKNR